MKYVVVTGGVVSGLGKGVTASSIGVLLKQCGLRVTSIKIDPYLNIDAGTMSPFEHGEVFVLDDGGEVRVPACGSREGEARERKGREEGGERERETVFCLPPPSPFFFGGAPNRPLIARPLPRPNPTSQHRWTSTSATTSASWTSPSRATTT